MCPYHICGTQHRFLLPIPTKNAQSSRMSKGEGCYQDVGRQTPAAGAHIFLGQPNIFFVTVNAKDRIPWVADATVQNSLAELWTKDATAWLVGYYLLMPDHLHFFCAPHDLHFD